MNFWGGGHLKHLERKGKKIVKESKKSEIIDRKKKKKENIGMFTLVRCINNIALYRIIIKEDK